MTHDRRDEFAKIQAILANIAQSQERTQAQQAQNTVAIAKLQQTQTQNLVAITELRQSQSENLVAIAELRQGLSETRQICDLNARNLEVMQSRIDGSFDLHERMMQIALEDRQQWREQRQGLIERYGEIADEQDDTRQSIQNLLEDARADRQAFQAQQQAARVANEREHQAFREIVRSMLTEIAQIWQRLAS